MTAPVYNWRINAAGLTLYMDKSDHSLLHYQPRAAWTPARESVLGPRLTSVTGEVGFDLSVTEYAKLKAALPGKRFAPLVLAGFSGALTLSITVPPPHALTLTVLETLPFPSVVFSAMLRNDAPDYQEVLDRVLEKWRNRSLIAGNLDAQVSMYEVDIAFLAVLRREIVDAALRSRLPAARCSRPALDAAVRFSVDEHLNEWVSALGPDPTIPAPETVRDFLAEESMRRHARPDGTLLTFDTGQAIPAWALRDPRELDPVVEIPLVRSSVKGIEIPLIAGI